jgi:hypothetical protein
MRNGSVKGRKVVYVFTLFIMYNRTESGMIIVLQYQSLKYHNIPVCVVLGLSEEQIIELESSIFFDTYMYVTYIFSKL